MARSDDFHTDSHRRGNAGTRGSGGYGSGARGSDARGRGQSAPRQTQGRFRSQRDGTSRRDGSSRRDNAPRRDYSRTAPAQTDLLHSDTAHEPISRHAFIMGALGAMGALAVGSLANYQIVNAGKYQGEANARRLLSQTLYAKRGTIYDRNGNVLVSSTECKNVYVNPQLIKKKKRKAAINALVEVLGIEREEAEDYVTRDTTFVYVKRQVDEEDAELLADYDIAGIEFEQAMKRVYPYGALASQVVGVVDLDNKGITGLESYYDEVLTGTNGSLVRERARDGSFIAGGAYEKKPAEDGMDIMLTLDVNIQSAAEEAIAAAVDQVGAKYGSVIVTDPTNGEILAACSYPTYDPNDLNHASNAAMNLRVVSDVYEPGSVFKTYVVAAGIELGLITPDTTFEVPAVVKAGDDDVRDVDKRDYGMTMTVREILRRSSNTGMILVGQKIGADDFDKHVIKGFHFGESTGIDFPGESLGIIKERDEYDGASLASMSFGQSLAVEPVQMVRAMSAIANGGIETTPHFVKMRAGEELDWTDGETRVISADTASQLADMMLTVVDEGTGSGAQVPGYEVSGKTGTAERASEGSVGYQEGNNMASFMGFVSTRDPRVLCYVTLDGTAAQSYAATPVFKQVMDEALPTLGIKPTR